jgi:hypothetical protein
MKNILTFIITISLFLLFSGFAVAQKGMGDDTGIVRHGLTPPVTSISGELLEIETGPCERTTGRAKIGTHLIIQDKDGQKLNIHLGPENAVDDVVEQLSLKQTLFLDVFHTEKMPANAYIAKSLTIDGKVIHLRDDNLRPVWAGSRGAGRGQGMRQGRGNWGPCW